MPPLDLIIAARIGLGHEPSGIVMLSRVETVTKEFDQTAGRWRTSVAYEVPAIERLPGGSSQSTVADTIQDLAELARDNSAERVKVVVDITACGRPFMKLLRERGVRAAAVMVGDAATTRAADRHWAVPMRELLSTTLGLLAEGRIEIADLPHAAKLVEELEAFRTKAPPRDALADWRPQPHVDLAGALMVAAWWGERMLRSIMRQPPPLRVPVEVKPLTFDQALRWAEARK